MRCRNCAFEGLTSSLMRPSGWQAAGRLAVQCFDGLFFVLALARTLIHVAVFVRHQPRVCHHSHHEHENM